MEAIVIGFKPSGLGRVAFPAMVSTGDRKSLGDVSFKLDTGSDFTTLSCEYLEKLGYTDEYLKSRPFHENKASTATDERELELRYIEHVSIKFGDRELQGCRIFFALGTTLHSLFGCDILKYFNREVDYDNCKLRLTERVSTPEPATGEKPIQIYALAGQ
jgi:hypothetical protein